MAFSNSVRPPTISSGDSSSSFTHSRALANIGRMTVADTKATGNIESTSFGSATRSWPGDYLQEAGGGLTNGFPSRDVARNTLRSRDGVLLPMASDTEVIEGKTGSGSLVDSSVSDGWNPRTGWGNKMSTTSGRSASNVRSPDIAFPQQQRSASNAGLATLPVSQQGLSSLSRPPAINLTSTATSHPRPTFTTPFTASHPTRTFDQAPIVYTKFDRSVDPNTKRIPDSPKDGPWAGGVSPTDVRGSHMSLHLARTSSVSNSRPNSNPPSRHSDEPPSFARADFPRASQRAAQNSSRNPSGSSQGRASFGSFANSSADQLSLQFENLNFIGEGRRESLRPNAAINGLHGQLRTVRGPSTDFRVGWSGAEGGFDDGDDARELDRSVLESASSEGFVSTSQHMPSMDYDLSDTGARFFQSPAAAEFRPAQHRMDGAPSPRTYDPSMTSRNAPGWQSMTAAMIRANRQAPALSEASTYLDPRMHHLLAHQYRVPYETMYNPYAFPTPLQLGPSSAYIPMMPLGLAGIDPIASMRDNSASEGVQSTLMYEFKSNTKSKRYELKDIYDHVAEFSGDQHGSRFIQTKLETANSDDKDRVFREIEPNAIPLMTDVFGNYVIQKFFEYGDQTHKKILANKMRGQVLTLSLQMYGCRVVQKALDHVLVDQQAQLVNELDGHVLKCVKDQNGNHVIQKAIERCPSSAIGFIIAAFQGQVQTLGIHPYGCRVIQRCLERCEEPAKSMVMNELMEGLQNMVSDQYGNYVVQHVAEHDDGEGRQRVLNIVSRNLEAFSKHKFASNVVEKCLEKADNTWRWNVVMTLANADNGRGEGEGALVSMIKDNFGNYVIQKLLDTLSAEDYRQFLTLLYPAVTQAKRTGCGKQVLSIEKKMHRFQPYRPGVLNGVGAFGSGTYQQLSTPASVLHSSYSSAATTPPSLAFDGGSLQSSTLPSINGDAVEGAQLMKMRKGSEPSTAGAYAR